MQLERHSSRATKALQKLVELDPTYASLSMHAKHRDATPSDFLQIFPNHAGELEVNIIKKDIAPAYTDGKTIYYGEEFENWSLDEQIAVCAHEVSHIAWRHPSRAQKLALRFGASFNHDIFNIAADAIINETLRLAGYCLPTPCIFLTELLAEVFGEKSDGTSALSEWSVEKLYVALMSQIPPMANVGSGQDQGQEQGQGQGQGQGRGRGPGQGPGQNQDDDPTKTDAQSPSEKARKYAESKGYKPDCAQSNQDKAQQANDDAEWQHRVARAMQAGREAGKGIGKLGFLIADLPKVKTPWEKVLKRLVSKALQKKRQITYTTPHIHWLAMQEEARLSNGPEFAYRPGVKPMGGKARILVGADNSMSISDDVLKIFAAEIASIGKKTGAEIHLVVFDDGILSNTKLKGVDYENEMKKTKFGRGGGTNFIPLMELAAEIDPSIIVVLTDLYGPFGSGPANKKLPVVWATPESNHPDAPYGRVITLDE